MTLGAWQRISPGGETRCARNTPFAFWVRRGDPSRLVFYLEPGGGCWDYNSCRPGSGLFSESVTAADDPTGKGGIFDFSNPRNPFRAATFVYVPYCTGDVHAGNRVQTYRSGSGDESVTIHHKGFVNASAALRWAYANVRAPASVLATGCSAGSAGSALVAPYLMEQYPQARVSQLGDSVGVVFTPAVDLSNYGAQESFPGWIPQLAALGPRDFTIARYYVAVARHYPNRLFAQFNTAHDWIQARYYEAMGGDRESFAAELARSLNEVERAAPNFRSFTAGGDAHCVLPSDRFYTYAVRGIPFRDWAADLAAGKRVPTLRCGDCDEPELMQP